MVQYLRSPGSIDKPPTEIDAMAFTPAQSEILDALGQAERCVAATGQALLQDDPERVHAATRDLHDSAHALALALRSVNSGATLLLASLRDRLVNVARDIGAQREALLRRSAMVERSLQALVPPSATQSSTYSGALGRYAGRAASASTFRSF
jgi:hypothetical protein